MMNQKMTFISSQVEEFLFEFCPSSSPLLLALSGGPDSLYLFYVLLFFRNKYKIFFHVAHVDHGWRLESREEAQFLQKLALQYHVPFHLKVLNPTLMVGNLEAACRGERYAFFAQLCDQFDFQGVLTGHHKDDQAETICKRVLEGAHWSRWIGLQPESWFKNIRILRPLLNISKNDIQKALSQDNIQSFTDPSNRDCRFLRARLRENIFPHLNKEFGKKVQNSFIAIKKDAQELVDYFDSLLSPILKYAIQGPWGIFLDLRKYLPMASLEIKYLLRLICRKKDFFLSRDIIEQVTQALQIGKANQQFKMGSQEVRIDRHCLFIVSSGIVKRSGIISLSQGLTV